MYAQGSHLIISMDASVCVDGLVACDRPLTSCSSLPFTTAQFQQWPSLDLSVSVNLSYVHHLVSRSTDMSLTDKEAGDEGIRSVTMTTSGHISAIHRC